MRTRYAPDPALTAALLVGGGVLAALALVVLAGDPGGRLLVGVCALGLLAEGARALLVRPTLAIDEAGLVIGSGLRTRHHPWSEVGEVRAHTSRRLLITRSLEIELDDALVVLAHYRLGARPEEVADAVEAARPVSR